MFSVNRFASLDLALCLQCNSACGREPVRRFFAQVSTLGNGRVWYAFMVVLPLIDLETGGAVTVQMMVGALLGVSCYKLIKHLTHRPRPYVTHAAIRLGTQPLDQFSFPSGHTLHAVLFSIIICAAFPVLAWVLVPFSLLTAASRIVLGLHYPSDVLLGALIGAVLAIAVLGAG